jgi:hypothetical protein
VGVVDYDYGDAMLFPLCGVSGTFLNGWGCTSIALCNIDKEDGKTGILIALIEAAARDAIIVV